MVGIDKQNCSSRIGTAHFLFYFNFLIFCDLLLYLIAESLFVSPGIRGNSSAKDTNAVPPSADGLENDDFDMFAQSRQLYEQSRQALRLARMNDNIY